MLLGENGVKPVYVKQRRDETLIILEGNSMLAKTEVLKKKKHQINQRLGHMYTVMGRAESGESMP